MTRLNGNQTLCAGAVYETWTDKDAYDRQLQQLAVLFQNAFEEYKDGASEAICAAGPVIEGQ